MSVRHIVDRTSSSPLHCNIKPTDHRSQTSSSSIHTFCVWRTCRSHHHPQLQLPATTHAPPPLPPDNQITITPRSAASRLPLSLAPCMPGGVRGYGKCVEWRRNGSASRAGSCWADGGLLMWRQAGRPWGMHFRTGPPVMVDGH